MSEHVKYAITIDKPRQDVYDFWREWTNLPRFSRHLRSVEILGDNRTRWTTDGPNGPVSWDAETVDDRPGEQIGWRSLPDSAVPNHGLVQFVDAPGGRGTEVRVYISFDPPMGGLGTLIAKSTGNEAKQEVAETLRRFKTILECGELPIVEGQPSSRMRREETTATESRKVGLR